MTLAPGSTLAAYAIERLLGRGGMGEVYLATHEGLGRKVALKLLAPELAADPAFRERFIAESRLAASLDHPHIVPIYEAGEADGRLFLAMRYVEGDDLGALIAGGPLEPARAVQLLSGIGAALDAARDRGLVHRDVKPANILVARTARGEEHAYLGDFGLTKLLGSDAGFTRSGQLVGSVDYVAPEQIEGRPVDGRVDVYSLACVLYTALTGRPPYRRETDVATLWAHVQAAPPRPSDHDPGLARYDPVIARGMAKDPADRHSTAGELMREARDARDGGAAAGDSRPATPAVERVAPPPSIDAMPAIRELPAQISELIGRERELAELAVLLSTHRLITITGPGGSGKTRLALEIGWTPPDATADVWFVDLAAIREPEMVPGAIASRLGITDDGKRGLVERLEAHLASRNALVILDNFEQILDAAPVIAGLLAKAPRLRILATSRAPLRIRGEREYPLGPLAVASAADPLAAIEQSAAVRLFVERARDAGATITVDVSNGPLLADICRRLDSLPLAIELAAARIRDLDLEAIASGLDRRLEMLTDGPRDAADRQRTVRLTIDWSHELLEPAEAELFRCLSAFFGGCSAEAAQSVCGDGLDGSVPALLAGLTAQSLLVRHPATEGSDQRYSMLETIREYAAERLELSSDGAPTRRRHAEYFASLAERAEAESRGPDAGLWRHRVRGELDNMRAAVGWAIAENAPETGLRLVAALRSYLLDIGFLSEGRDWLARLLELPGPRSDRVQANALNAAGNLAWIQADFDSARAHHTASLALRREIGEPEPIAASLSNLALVSWQAGDYRGAQELLEDSLAKSREAGDAWGVVATLGNLADVAIFELDFERAETLYTEALAAFRALGDVGSIPKVLSNLGELAIYRGDDDAAAAILAEARTLAEEIEDDAQINTIRINLGHVAVRRGDFVQARKLLAESLEYSQTTGEMVRVVECLERLGELVAREGDHVAAARIWGAAAALRRDVGAEMYPVDRAWYDRAVATTRATMGDPPFESEWAAGERADHKEIAAAYLAAGSGAAAPSPASPARAAPHNLPVQLSSFVGRATELGDLVRRLPDTRLVTLTGPGGTGKTRLAIQAATVLTRVFQGGVYLVELASITDPELAPSQIASALGVSEDPGQPIEESLARYLEPSHVLLVLDNLEQVPGIAPFVARLLARCSSLHVLATSRVPLHVRGEEEYAVSPLGVPVAGTPQTAEGIGESDAVMLFAARAAGIRADFRLTDQNAPSVAAISVRVDGLPLAIELAAARVKLLSPSQILSRLDDRLGLLTGGARDLPERQQTLRATIAWSHDLLDEPEKVLFRRLSVFDGSLTFAAAEAVCGDGPDGQLLESMTTLVDGSLLRPISTDDDEPRFAMLETIREYAADQLVASGEADAIARRHFDYFFDLGRRFAEELGSSDLVEWLHRLDADRANLSAAMNWSIGADEAGRAAELFEFLRDYTRAHGRSAEARSLVATLLAHGGLTDAQRGKLVHEAAVLAVRQGDMAAVHGYATEALLIARKIGDSRGAVGAGQMLALSAAERGDTSAEADAIREMLEDADRAGEPRMEILARSVVALRSLRLGEFDEAAAQYDEIVTRMRHVDVMRESLGAGLLNRGLSQLHAGRLPEAAGSLAESAEIGQSMEDLDLLGYVLEGYAALAAAIDRHGQAARFQGASATALSEVGSVLEAFEAQMRQRTARAAREALGDDLYESERSAGAALPTSEAIGLAVAFGANVATGEATSQSG